MTISTLQLQIMLTLLGAVSALLLVRWIRLRNRGPVAGPEGTPVSARKVGLCVTSSTNVVSACAEGWWEHWWDGLPYCDDVEATCKAYGGTFKYIN